MQLTIPDHLSGHRRAVLTTAADSLSEQLGSDLLGLVLSGSAGRGLETERSDLDLLVVVSPEVVEGPSAPWLHTAELEQIPLSLDHLRTVAGFGEAEYAYRWSYSWAPVLADTDTGDIAAAVERQTHLTVEETVDVLVRHGRLGAWLNLTFRALKSARAGRPLETRLDAVEALPFFLDIVFALEGLVRPYSSYLPWALTHHPLPGWPAGELLHLVERMLEGDPSALRLGVSRIHERASDFATTHGDHGIRGALEEWYGDDYGAVLGLRLP